MIGDLLDDVDLRGGVIEACEKLTHAADDVAAVVT